MQKFIRRLVSGLRWRLLLLVLLACAPLVGLTLHTASEERRQLVKDWKQRSQAMVELATQEEDQVIEQTRQLLLAVAESSQVRSGNRRDCEKLLAALFASHSHYANLGVIKTNGDFLASVRTPAIPANPADLQFLDRMLETRAFAIGNFPVGPTNGKPTINFCHPVFDPSGQVVQAVAFAVLDPDWFDRSGSKLLAQLPKGAIWTEIDRDGKILVRYPSPEQWIGQPFPEQSLLNTVWSQNQGVVEAVSPDGLPDYFAFAARRSRLVPGNLVTILGIPKQLLFAEVDRRLVGNLIGLGIAAGFAFTLGWIGSSLLVLRPVRTLVKSSARLATGDFSTRTGMSHRGDELGQLSQTFDQMAQALEHREVKRQSAENALKTSEMRYRRLFEAAQDGILILNADSGQIDDVNPFLTELLGYTREQLLGNKLWEVGPFKDTQAAKAEFRELQRETYVRYDDLPLETRAGKSINVEFVSNVYQVNGGKVIQCNIRDITKRKHAEARLQLQSTALEAAANAIIITDRSGAISWANSAFTRLTGYSATEVLGANMRLLKSDQHDQAFYQNLWQTILDGRTWHAEIINRRKNGSLYTEDNTITAVRDARGEITHFISVKQDITERKQAEEELRRNEIRLRGVVESTADGLLVVDRNGKVIIQNGRFGEMWRIPGELQASGDDNALLAHVVGQLSDPEAFLARVRALYGTDAEDKDELRFKDGRVFERFSRPLMLQGAVMGRVWSFRDITERKQAEAKRKAYSRKLQVLSRRLVEAQETERRNIARELHDEIGQALTVMQLNLQAMLQSPGTDALTSRLSESLAVVERVLEQVQDISLNLRPSILDDLGLEPALRWYTERQAALLELKVEFHADGLQQRLDPVIETECFRVAQEALTNVVRHAQAKAVTVELRKDEGQLHLRVRDDGIGFAVADVRENAVRGASLGLLSMEERAALAGGGLEFTCIPGQGTEVHAWFPLKWQTPASGFEIS